MLVGDVAAGQGPGAQVGKSLDCGKRVAED